MTTKTTIHLKLPRWPRIPNAVGFGLSSGMMLSILWLTWRLLNPVLAAPTPAPVLIIATARTLPTSAPLPTATPDGELVLLRQRIVALEAAQAAPAAYVEVQPAVEYVYVDAVPTFAPAALAGQPIVMDADEQAAVDRQFGVSDAERAAALAEHLARQALLDRGAWASEAATARAGPQSLTSADLPCNCDGGPAQPDLQSFAPPSGEEPMSDATMREAQDK